ncbi:MAG: hypothetical protein IT289_10480 [Oligoflexia bacterium]|nr:hypothetical protein [Oligoflexia bacterium]
MKILFMLSGSIAAYKACEVISTLVKAGHQVKTVVTPDALKFIGRSTLEGLTGEPVSSDSFEPGKQMDHIHLARWADMALLAPCSAQTLANLAHGLAPNLVNLLFLAWEIKTKPFFIAPAMNQAMWDHPAVQNNVKQVQTFGVKVIEPGTGPQACGEHGQGRLAEPNQIIETIFQGVRK